MRLPAQSRHAVVYARRGNKLGLPETEMFHGTCLPSRGDEYTWAAWFMPLADDAGVVVWRNLQICGDLAGGIEFERGRIVIQDCGKQDVENSGFFTAISASPLRWHFAGVSRRGGDVAVVIDGYVVPARGAAPYGKNEWDSWLFGASLGWGNVAIAYTAIYTEALGAEGLLRIWRGERVAGAAGEYAGDNFDPETLVWEDSSGNGRHARCFGGVPNCGCGPGGCNCAPASPERPRPLKLRVDELAKMAGAPVAPAPAPPGIPAWAVPAAAAAGLAAAVTAVVLRRRKAA
jgi:hypothetical protein